MCQPLDYLPGQKRKSDSGFSIGPLEFIREFLFHMPPRRIKNQIGNSRAHPPIHRPPPSLHTGVLYSCGGHHFCDPLFPIWCCGGNKWHGPRLLPNHRGKGKGRGERGGCLLRWLLREVLEERLLRGVGKGVVKAGCEGGMRRGVAKGRL